MRDLANQSYTGSKSSGFKLNSKLIRFIVVLVVLAAAIYFVVGRVVNFTSGSVPGGVVLQEAPRGLEPVAVDSSFDVVGDGVELETETADLTLVKSGFSGEATVTRSYGESTFILNVDATLEDPEGHKYGVWLISGNERLIVGHMSGVSEFRLRERRNDQELLTYDEVWITLERAEDDEPEDHIFEGSF